MEPSSASTATAPNTPAGRSSALRVAAVWALAATLLNLLLWGIGRTAGASLVVDPALGDPDVEVGAVKVVVTTLLPLAVGVLILAMAEQRSRRWAVMVTVAGAAFALASAAGPLDGGHDTATGVLLATMHLTTGAAFVVTATRFRRLHAAKSGATARPPARSSSI